MDIAKTDINQTNCSTLKFLWSQDQEEEARIRPACRCIYPCGTINLWVGQLGVQVIIYPAHCRVTGIIPQFCWFAVFITISVRNYAHSLWLSWNNKDCNIRLNDELAHIRLDAWASHGTFCFPIVFHVLPTKIIFSPDPPLLFPISVTKI